MQLIMSKIRGLCSAKHYFISCLIFIRPIIFFR